MRLAADQKKGRVAQSSLVFVDESGFLLQPLVRRTWAPRGQTPIHYSWDRHDRLSVIAALTLSPEQRRIGLYFQVLDRNVRAPQAMSFLREVHRQLRRDLIVIWDRSSVHRSAAKQLLSADHPWLEVEWLPPYAPDLNPVEAVWSHNKYSDLANFLPDDKQHLEDQVVESLRQQYHDQPLKRSFFQAAELKL